MVQHRTHAAKGSHDCALLVFHIYGKIGPSECKLCNQDVRAQNLELKFCQITEAVQLLGALYPDPHPHFLTSPP